ncbi:MAG: glycosyltransferase family 4 protein [Acidobacteriota bacterium]|nr:glycosyltransferase family 4 protein [Acidobacteriota bacterium]
MRLVVFFSRGMSLDGWRRAGILDRELALYRSLLPHLEHLAFVTYGGADDLRLARQVVGIEILPNRWGLPSNLYSVLAPYLHRRTLGRATVFKTNQINGAWCAVIAKWLFRKKLVVRCGYLWSDFMVRLTTSRWRRALAGCLERATFQVADAVIVAGHADRMTIIRRYGVNAECMHVVPNYVDTSLFRVMPEVPRESGRVIFVGRLENQKNPLALIEALKELPGVKLSIIGNGSLRANLEERVREYGVEVEFLGAVPHEELPRLLNGSEVFILPSHYEGNPKALIEAMACGLPVIATRVPGIQQVLVHEETGFLCGTSAADLRAALRAVLERPELRERMASRGLAYARERFALARVAQQELAALIALS